ncbi:hypothetical protein VNI00_010305 [Paramarasmius palmivorus]|uniref:Glycoside hydrolase family 76 protein n=1 Tax=Paramarasmius palmivorus TaxID=297713 RepID=A0AAW0CHA3_9AGAR
MVLWVLFAMFPLLYSQSLVPPKLWNYNVSQNRQDRLNTASAALQMVIPRLGKDGMIPGDENAYGRSTEMFYAVATQYDAITEQKTFESTTLIFSQGQICLYFPNFVNDTGDLAVEIRDAIQVGYTAIRAYIAYSDPDLLRRATECWELVNRYTISEETFQPQVNPAKNFTILSECSSRSSTIGATFHDFYRDSSDVTDVETGYFCLLSSILAEVTKNNTYTTAAQRSADFLYNNFYRFTDSGFALIPQTDVRKGSPMACNQQDFNVPYTSFGGTTAIGLLIEGMSILSTLSHNSTIDEKLLRMVVTTLNYTQASWPSPSGILRYRGPNLSDGIDNTFLVRGLAEAYRRIDTLPANVRSYIQAFIGVQYSAIRRFATSGDDIYGGNWEGPPSSDFDVVNQTQAAQVLVSGIYLFNDSAPETPSSTSVPSSKPPVAVITGSVIGGVLLLMLIAFVAYRFLHHGVNASGTSDAPGSADPRFEVTPFVWMPAEQSTNPQSETTQKSKEEKRSQPPSTEPQNEANSSERPPSTNSGRDVAPPEMRQFYRDIPAGAPFPDVVRMLYQRMWQPDSHEVPPDYESQHS